MIEFRRLIWRWLTESPGLWLAALAAACGLAFAVASLYRVGTALPRELGADLFRIVLRVTLVALVLGFLTVRPFHLVPRGLPPAFPLADGALLLGGAVPFLAGATLLALLTLGPMLIGLPDRTPAPAALLFSVMALGFLLGSSGWLALVAGIVSGRFRVAAGLCLGAGLWGMVGTAWLNPLSLTRYLGLGLVLLAGMDLVACHWVLQRFTWRDGSMDKPTAPPVGHRWPFWPGRAAWLSLEFRLVLRDRLGWALMATAVLGLWLIIGLMAWAPRLFRSDGLATARDMAAAARYFIPVVYMGVFFLATGPLRARGMDLPVEIWLRTIPHRTADYTLGKGLVHLSVAGAVGVIFLSGISLLAAVGWQEVLHASGRAGLLALVSYSLAYLWGTLMPLRDEDSALGLVHFTLFALACMAVYQLAGYSEAVIGHRLAPVLTGVGMALCFMVLAVAAEERRRAHAP